MLPFALHGHHTSLRTSKGETPLSLLYGMEAVLPLEVEIPSMRVLMEAKLFEAEWYQSRYSWTWLKRNAWLPCVMDSYIKRGWNKLLTRRFVPVNFEKETLFSKRYYLFNRTQEASGRLITKAHMLSREFFVVVQWLLRLWMVTNSYVLWTSMQSRNTLSGKYKNSSVSRNPEKAA